MHQKNHSKICWGVDMALPTPCEEGARPSHIPPLDTSIRPSMCLPRLGNLRCACVNSQLNRATCYLADPNNVTSDVRLAVVAQQTWCVGYNKLIAPLTEDNDGRCCITGLYRAYILITWLQKPPEMIPSDACIYSMRALLDLDILRHRNSLYLLSFSLANSTGDRSLSM